MDHLRRHRQLLARIVVVVGFVAGALALPATAGADAKSERADVQKKRAAVAAEIDTLRATDRQVEQALAALDQHVATQTAALRDAERALADAEATLAEATGRVVAKEAEIVELDAAVKELAVEAYIRPPQSNALVDSLQSQSIGEAELKQALVEAKSAAQLDTLDLLARAREDLEIARAEAEAATQAALTHQQEVDSRLAEVTSARDEQARVAAAVQSRLDHRLSEAANLADLDRQLAAEIAAEQARLASRLAAERGGSGGPITITGSGSIVSVRGIRVHKSIADEVAAMLSAADADGISLHGGGYRDPQRQIELRRRHCGTSNYDVYHKPPSQCRPPTARPGQSMHERGLAIDFTYQGRAIRSRSSPAYQWLRANAARYGFYNLPSEPWHWSVNGR